MKKNIVFLDEYTLNGADMTAIKSLGNYTGYEDTPTDEVMARSREADILIVNKVQVTGDAMRQLPRLRLICVAATGVNNIDTDTAAGLGIEVRNAKGYSTHSVAETTLGCALGLMREMVYYDGYVKSGAYSRSPRLFNYDRPTRQLYGKNWGVVGLGAIGREVARLATAFGCRVAYHSTSGTERPEEYPEKPLRELLAWADVVSIHAPLTDATRGLIGERELSYMKPDAVLINVARGGIVDEAALAGALNNGTLAGAGLDVFSDEPVTPDNPLFGVDDRYKLLLSPHNAWSAGESINNLVKCLENNIREFLSR